MKKLFVGLSAAAAICTSAFAQNFPDRPIKFIVPFPAGQASDIVARVAAEQLSQRIKQPVIVENRVGAGGSVGTEAGTRAKPDGYTLTVATAALPISQHVRKLNFHASKDFAPVSLLTITPLVMVSRPDLPAQNVTEVIELMKKEPGKYTFASSGAGTSHHLSGELFKAMNGLDILHVPYQGSSAAHIDLMAGRVDIMFDNILPLTPHLKHKKLKGYAVTTQERASSQPHLPTMAEAGYPKFEAVAWFGLLAPAGTPQEIVELLNKEVNAGLQTPAAKTRLEGMGGFVQNMSASAFKQFLDNDIAKWEPVVKQANIQLD